MLQMRNLNTSASEYATFGISISTRRAEIIWKIFGIQVHVIAFEEVN